MAAGMSADELARTFDQVKAIAGLVDETFIGQVEEELGTFERVTHRKLSESEAATLRDRLLGSMREIWVDVGLTHPSFKKLAIELSEEGAAGLGIA
jgi:hypothetical protein